MCSPRPIAPCRPRELSVRCGLPASGRQIQRQSGPFLSVRAFSDLFTLELPCAGGAATMSAGLWLAITRADLTHTIRKSIQRNVYTCLNCRVACVAAQFLSSLRRDANTSQR